MALCEIATSANRAADEERPALADTDRRDKSLGAIEFVMNHEVGHALVDLFDRSTTGSGEDTADQISTYLLIQQKTDRAINAAWSGAAVLDLLGEGKPLDDARLSDEHTVNRARYFNIACWIYGSAPSEFAQQASVARPFAESNAALSW